MAGPRNRNSGKESADDIDVRLEYGNVGSSLDDEQRISQDPSLSLGKRSSIDGKQNQAETGHVRRSLAEPPIASESQQGKRGPKRRKSSGDEVEAAIAERQKVPGSKQLNILDRPEVMIFSLKRFNYDYASGRTTKDCSDVEIGPLTIPASNGHPAQQYEPHAILCHSGDSPNSGHYFTYRNVNGQWWRFNDTEVSKADQRDNAVIQRRAYVVLYRRVEANGAKPAADNPLLE